MDPRERSKIWECKDERVAWGSGSAHQQHGRSQKRRGLDHHLHKARKDQSSPLGKEGGEPGQCGALEAKRVQVGQHGQYCLILEVVILLNESLEKAT